MASPQPAPDTSLDFTHSDTLVAELLDHLRATADLRALGALASWDQNTALPDGAGEIRGHQLATLQGVLHDRWTAERLGTLLSELAERVTRPSYSDADRGLLREARRAYDHAAKLPRGLVEEMALVEAGAFESWRRARARNDFASFAPWLSRVVTLQREVADHLGYTESRYDALLDQYEPGMTTRRLDALFPTVREASVTLLRRIAASGAVVDDSCLNGSFDPDTQVRLCERVLRAIGYDFARGGIARSPHPFTTDFGSPFDVRVTVRTDERFLPTSVMAAVHEGGHALYEQGSAPILARTPLAGGASLGAHESQSRLWENAIGRSEPFWRGQFALVREAFPHQFANGDPATFARALNTVRPSLIRVEADEVTYNLHILIRYELERGLMEGTVSVEELPRLWNAKYQAYLGVEPPTDADGVLQDVHWTSGFGYFPTYTLGNLYGAQIYAALRRGVPDLDDRLAHGETAAALSWLQRRMYRVGATYTPDDLIERVTGAPPDPTYFTRYLDDKFSAIYGLAHP